MITTDRGCGTAEWIKNPKTFIQWEIEIPTMWKHPIIFKEHSMISSALHVSNLIHKVRSHATNSEFFYCAQDDNGKKSEYKGGRVS